MRIINAIILIILRSTQYVIRGFKVVSKGIVYILLSACLFVYKGFSGIYKIIMFPFKKIGSSVNKLSEIINSYQKRVEEKQRLEEEERAKKRAEEAKRREEKAKQAEEARRQALKAIKERNEKEKAAKEALEKQKEQMGAVKKDSFVNDLAEEDFNKGLGGRINMFLETIISVPVNFFKKAKKEWENSAIKRNLFKEKDINREALILNLDGEDSEKQDKKVMWEYVCKTPEGKQIKGYFAAYSRLEVHSFLMSEGMTIYSIRTNKWIQTMYSSVNGNGAKIKKKDLIFFLTQLSTYIKSGIPLVDAFSILSRQFKDKNYQRMFRAMMYDLTMGESFSKAMENQGNSFPPILINMVKSSELTGELPEALDDMAEYFTQTEEAKKEMISAMTYPVVVLLMAIGVSVFMMIYIVPQFAEMFTNMGSEVPAFTKFVLDVSNFLQTKWLPLVLWIVGIIGGFIYLYKNVKIWRTMAQWVMMHIPVMGNIIIYNEVAMFSKTFSSLLSHNVFITDSMNVLKRITNNEIYKLMIFDTVNNLAAGEKISTAFKDHWAFPAPAYEMIVTGEKTGQLAEMMGKVSTYYQSEHKNSVTRVKSLMEPVIIVFLTVVVGAIVLAIVIPMFSMYQSVGGM